MSEAEEVGKAFDSVLETAGEASAEVADEATTAVEEQQAALGRTDDIMEEESKEMQGEVEDEIKDGIDEVQQDMKDAKDATSLGEKAKKWVVENIWENRKAFGKFVGLEIGKGALFTVGMQAVSKAFEKTSNQPNATGDQKAAFQLASALQTVSTILQQVSSDWQVWMAKHFDDQDNYGSVSVEGTDILRFQILQNKIRDMTSILELQVAAALKASQEQKTKAALVNLGQAYKLMLDKANAVSTDISTKEQAMVADGLNDNKDNLDKAAAALNTVITA